MMLRYMACLTVRGIEARIQSFLVPLGPSGHRTRAEFLRDEDSALDPSNVIYFTPCGIELLRLV
jgi:hypothetical protein